MALHVDDIDGFGAEAPRPLDDAALERGSFEHLREGQGAVRVRRDAKPSAAGPLHGRALVAVMAAVALVIVLGGVLFSRVLSAAAVDDVGEAEAPAYELAQVETGYALVEHGDDGSELILGDLSGMPVELFQLGDTIVIPQNEADGTWDVEAYTLGVGWSAVVDESGNPQAGEGTIEGVRLDGSTLVLTVDGAELSVPLAW